MEFKSFHQAPPFLENQYADDAALRAYLARTLPADVLTDIEPELQTMGAIAVDMYDDQLRDRLNEPVLVSWSPWGERIDELEVTRLWSKAARIAAERGVVATGYEGRHGPYARVHQFALAYLFGASSDVYTCPLAMTDGAAHTLLASGNEALIEHAVPRLTSRNPEAMWTSGQWMTESTGGSDVGLSETVATQDATGQWRLWGRKWFTSAVTSPMALTLGRPEGNGAGGEGLALFYVETRDEEGQLANIEIDRLKDKLGTRKVPTAELTLRGTPATLVRGASGGVRDIAPMLNITRTWNAIQSVATMRRGIALARSYASRRIAFGETLAKKALHLDTLAGLQAELEAGLQLAFLLAELLGTAGSPDSPSARLLRLLTPIVKLTTAKQAVAVTSEVLEAFGGAGYVEDTGLPTLLRDAQVLPIWEGTTNILALDTVRVAMKDPDALEALRDLVAQAATLDGPLQDASRISVEATADSLAWLHRARASNRADALEAGARRFAVTLGRATALALLIRQAEWSAGSGDPRPVAAVARFARSPIHHLATIDLDESKVLALG